MTTHDPGAGTGRRRSLLRTLPVLVLVALIAAVCGLLTGYRVSLSPVAAHPRGISFASARTTVLIDRRDSVLGSGAQPRGAAPINTLQTLSSRAQVFATIAASPSGRASIGRRLGLDASQVAVENQLVASIPRSASDPRDKERASQLLDEKTRVSVLLRVDVDSPSISIYVRAPTAAQAERTANATSGAISDSVVRAASEGKSGRQGYSSSLVARPLGNATGAMVSQNAPIQAAILVGLAVFGIGTALVLRLRRRPAGRTSGDATSAGLRDAAFDGSSAGLPDATDDGSSGDATSGGRSAGLPVMHGGRG